MAAHPTPPHLPPQVGAERYNMFMGCPQARTATIVLRGGSEQVRQRAMTLPAALLM